MGEEVSRHQEIQIHRQKRALLKASIMEVLNHLSPSVLLLIATCSLQLCVLTYVMIQDMKYSLEQKSSTYGTVLGIPKAAVVYVAYMICAIRVIHSAADAGYHIEVAVSISTWRLEVYFTSFL